MRNRKVKAKLDKPVTPPARPRAFDGILPTAKPCPVCLRLLKEQQLEPESVMPLPPFPARSRKTSEPVCRDCQATETAMRLMPVLPGFGPARLTVANERMESLRMPLGMAELFGMCRAGIVLPASFDDLGPHQEWMERNGIGPTEDDET